MEISTLIVELYQAASDGIVNYHKEFRPSLFATNIAVGSFLFSMKSFIIKTMKDDFYSKKEYLDDIISARQLGSKEKFYGPLKRLSCLLRYSIIVSFISAILQITLGYCDTKITSLICLTAAAISWVLIFISVFWVGRNWDAILDKAEEKAEFYETEKSATKNNIIAGQSNE